MSLKTTMRFLILLITLFSIQFSSQASEIVWQQLTPATFEQAKKENKIILLNLEANWCHWCHVMHDSTYSNPKVLAYLNEHFITVKADQDANPELSNRYKDWGWPATIFINADGEDVVKRAGYIAPEDFLRLLKAIVKDPSPEEALMNLSKVTSTRSENPELQAELIANFGNSLDYKVGGFDQSQKYVEFASFEYAVFQSKDEKVKSWIKKSVEGAKQLSDPAWGGIYQYSTNYDWQHLHFEKLLSIQARYTSIFLLNYYYNKDEESLDFSQQIMNYADRFLVRPNGLYANAQDADLVQGEHSGEYFALSDKERLKLGIPKVDTNTFTDNNAAFAIALSRFGLASGKTHYCDKAQRILEQLLLRKMSNGLYSHAISKTTIASLRDQIAMAELLVEFTKNDASNVAIKSELTSLLNAIALNFTNENGSLKSFSGANGLTPQPIIEENIRMARIFNWYGAFAHESDFQMRAKKMYSFLISDGVSNDYYNEPALLMLEKELEKEPTQYVYLQTGTGENFNGALHSILPFYSIIYDGKLDQLPLEKQDLIGGFTQNVLLMCTSSYCSSPTYTLDELMNHLP